ncbi:MAG TPA: hypothetical protein VK421_05010 [Pyrinomonadaceae bacterium]|nr:hypothetical protein [Pyrinomonadaceae bacterium]
MRSPAQPARAALLAAILILCAADGISQEAQEKQAPPSGLALEVDTKEGPVGHLSVPGQSFGGRYRRLPSWRPTAGSQQRLTFKQVNVVEGDAVRVKVFALMDRFHDQEVLIGDYLLREGEKAVVESMRAYGFEPMELTVVRLMPVPLLPPTVTSRVPSVVAAGIREKQANFPTYMVTLRNLSHKDLTYLEIKSSSTVQWPRGEQNRPVLKAGEAGEVRVFAADRGQKSPAGFTPAAAQNIEIVTAVFADESYEGEPRSAVIHIAMMRGQRLQIERALALWEGASAGDRGKGRTALEEFERRVDALGREAPATLDDVLAGINGVARPEYEGLRRYVEAGLDQARKELLKDVREYRQAGERSTESKPFEAWLGDLKKKYEDWLSRLRPAPAP